MRLRPLLRLLMKPLDVVVELLLVHSPHAAATDLDRGQLAGANQRIHLWHRNAQVGGHVLIVLMSSALVVAIWGIAQDRLVDIVSAALSNVCGSVGC